MKDRIQTASEANNSTRTGTLAHETRKNRMSKRNLLKLACVLFAACFIFAGCDNDDDDDKGGFKIVGKLDDASHLGDVKTVKFILWDNVADKGVSIAEADFNNGDFTLILPETIDPKILSSIKDAEFPPSVTISSSNPDAKGSGEYYIEGYNSAGKHIANFGYVKVIDNTKSYMGWMYVDSDVSIKGTATDEEDYYGVFYEYNNTYSLDLKKGWNVFYVSDARTEQDGKRIENFEMRTDGAISGLKWVGELD